MLLRRAPSTLIYVLMLLSTSHVPAAATAPPSAGTLELIKGRFTEQVTSRETAAAAAQYAASLLPNGTWSDIDYTDKTRGAWKTETHMSRVVTLAQALPFAAPENRSILLHATISSLGNWLQHDYRNPNWWYAVIGIPVDLIAILLNIDAANATNALSHAQREKALELMERSGFANSNRWTGANLADVMKSQIARGLIFDNATAVVAGFARVWAELYVSDWNDDNIQADGSFHQHSQAGVRGSLLAGSYGKVFTSDMLGFVGLASGTSLAMSIQQARVFSSLLLDGQRWMITTGNQWDWSVIGRGNSAPGEPSVDMFGGHSKFITEIDLPARQTELSAFAACLNSSTCATQPIITCPSRKLCRTDGKIIITVELISYSNLCAAGTTPGCVSVTGNRHFFDSDYHVHRRAGWMATVRMYSTRTIAARCVNNQGKRNSHEADGVTNLYLSSDGNKYPCTYGCRLSTAYSRHMLASTESIIC